MKICHITTVHPAHDARIFYRMCAGLAAKGHEVTLIASAPFAGEFGVRSSPWNKRIAPAGRISRIILALRAALAENADIYHFHDPELISLGLALKLLRPSKIVVYDVHEDYPSMMLEKYWIPQPIRPLISTSRSYWARNSASSSFNFTLPLHQRRRSSEEVRNEPSLLTSVGTSELERTGRP